MRLLLVLLFSLLPVSSRAEPCEGFNNTMEALEVAMAEPKTSEAFPATAFFVEEFSSFDELKKWAHGSTWGGGNAEQIDFQGHKLALAFRSYTSGVISSDIAVYQQVEGKWVLIKTHPPVMQMQSRIVRKVFDDKIIFHSENSDEALLVLTAKDLQ